MNIYSISLGLLLLLPGGCRHNSSGFQEGIETASGAISAYADEFEEADCNSTAARIWTLINNGQLAEAQFLIAEAKASGLITASVAARMLDKIALLNTRVGQLPATLQRARNFPSQLKDYTLLEVRQMLDRKDFSLATEAQLKMVSKIIKSPDRLMEKL